MNTKKKIGARIAACLLAAGVVAGVGVVAQSTIAPLSTVESASAARGSSVQNQCAGAVLIQNDAGNRYWLSGYHYASNISYVWAGNNGLLVNGTYYRNTWVGPLRAYTAYYLSTCWA